jgi:acyl carrier protein
MQQPTKSSYVNNDIFKLLTKTFFVNPAAIHKATQFVNHLKFSYLELTELVVMIELKYNVTFADDEVHRLKRVGDLDRLLVGTQRQQ